MVDVCITSDFLQVRPVVGWVKFLLNCTLSPSLSSALLVGYLTCFISQVSVKYSEYWSISTPASSLFFTVHLPTLERLKKVNIHAINIFNQILAEPITNMVISNGIQ